MVPRPRKAGSKDLPDHLYKKTDKRTGRTYYTYHDPASGRWFGLGTDKAAAIRQAKEANAQLQAPLPSIREREHDGRTLAQWIERYKEELAERDLAAATRRNQRMRLNVIAGKFGERPIAALTTQDWADWLREYAAAGKRQMAAAMRSLARDMYREAIAAGWAETNPLDVTRAPRIKIKRQRLTLELWRAIYAEAKRPWLKRAMELAMVTAQRREDIARMMFADSQSGALQVIQSKTGARLRISHKLKLDALGLTVGDVVKRCRDTTVSKYLVHHPRTVSRAKAGDPVLPDTLSDAFAKARDRAAAKLGVDLGEHPPTFHEMRSLAARLYHEQGYDPQRLLGHRHRTTTELYQDNRGSEWVDVSA